MSVTKAITPPFFKISLGSATPIVMYFDNSQAVYAELKQLMKSPTPVLVEKEPMGPIKKLCFVSTQIAGVVLQEEPYVQ